ncbi:short-chain dehydrogenase/reductase SDR [Natrialba chahannaoensis JCM 10990]|uniref:Short-chain dehydrogenase/reductase SDR n=1 Tax=Natrialba chahannaoensis JCM 10990 TaxID=1227492 RepID=M0AK89_9EURY|nr:SDR family NAD(P)-dependent oxidoreductase [Natrialba chahannaoensis]ELY98332.1 short-chain dehydrogenase/reductase SDR [Natrialba chahannaoensis JCM 10990]
MTTESAATDQSAQPRGAIIVGASSGIGAALAHELAADGYEVGLTARRTEQLKAVGGKLPTKAYVATMDVTDTETAREHFFELADAMPSVDLVVISAGVGDANYALEWETERQTIDVNVRGFTAIATAAMEYFESRAGENGVEAESEDENRNTDESPGADGHLVGLSSVAAYFGNGGTQAYNASKAYVSRYLEGLRSRQVGNDADITITTIEPGFVDTELSYGSFWECSPETAASQIADAIHEERDHAYVTRRWRLVTWVLKALPESAIRRLFA